jgi:hypothetical protein
LWSFAINKLIEKNFDLQALRVLQVLRRSGSSHLHIGHNAAPHQNIDLLGAGDAISKFKDHNVWINAGI